MNENIANTSALEVLDLLEQDELWKPILEECEPMITEDEDDDGPVRILLTSAGWLISTKQCTRDHQHRTPPYTTCCRVLFFSGEKSGLLEFIVTSPASTF